MDPSSPSWGEVFAHGIGGQKDLPIPLELTIAGAVAALTVSFTVLAVAWRTPRYDDATSGRAAGCAYPGRTCAPSPACTAWSAPWRASAAVSLPTT